MAVVTITLENFEAEVLQSTKPVLVDFWAPWCGPCRMLSPVVDEIAEENSNIKVGKVNVDEQEELAMRFGIMSIPTLIVFKNGEVVKKTMGVQPKAAILGLFEYGERFIMWGNFLQKVPPHPFKNSLTRIIKGKSKATDRQSARGEPSLWLPRANRVAKRRERNE